MWKRRVLRRGGRGEEFDVKQEEEEGDYRTRKKVDVVEKLQAS